MDVREWEETATPSTSRPRFNPEPEPPAFQTSPTHEDATPTLPGLTESAERSID